MRYRTVHDRSVDRTVIDLTHGGTALTTQRITKPKAPATFVIALAAALTLAPDAASAAGTTAIGPSTTTSPYVLPVADDVSITSLLTVNDAGSASNGYELVGIPDGIGVGTQGGRIVLYLNHELRDTQGIPRRHGQPGAFASRLVLDPATLRVTHGSDLVDPGVRFWDYPSGTYVTSGALFPDGVAQEATFGRWCSSTLSDPGLFFSESKGMGYAGQLYFGNEEDGDIGRTFGVTTAGRAQALPRLGLFQWENTIPATNRSETTLVMGQEDGPAPGPGERDGSQLWVYVGTKQNTGNAFARAGLTNGSSFVVDATDPAVTDDPSWRATFDVGESAPVVLNEVDWNQTGLAQNIEARNEGLSLNRIEDGFWDPRHPRDFYFLTTEGGDTATTFPYTRDGGGLWRLRFRDIEHPERGGRLTLLLDGSEEVAPGEPKFNKPDNMTIDKRGNILIQEDPGGNDHLARVIAYRIKDGALGIVARFDPARFGPEAAGSSAFLTVDEESSGIIDAEAQLGRGAFFLDAQVHTAAGLPAGTGPGTVQEFVENGQLLLLRVGDWSQVYGD